MKWSAKYKQELDAAVETVHLSGGQEKINKLHYKQKLTARERIEALFDDRQYTEIQMFVKTRIEVEGVKKKHYLGDGVVAAFGRVNGKIVYAIAQDSTVSGGAGGETQINKICRTLELAIENHAPMIFLCDSGGARIEEGILSLAAYSRLFYLNTKASGMILQIAAIMGNCAGGSSYSPAMCDFLFMVKGQSQLFITGPKVIKSLTGEQVTMDELGGSDIHSKYSGQAHFVAENDRKCIEEIRNLLLYFQQPMIKGFMHKNLDYRKRGREIEEIIPEYSRKAYDVKKVILQIVDDGSFLEVSEKFALNMVIGFARLEGRTIGIVANQPNYLGGAIDCDASDKCARFVRICDSFNLPMLVLVDVPGFYPGAVEEKKGILRHGSKILYAFSEATVPSVTLIMRKAYGGAYCAMNSKDLGADMVYAWPICELAVMGADGAVDVIYHKEIAVAENQEEYIRERIKDYEDLYLNPYYAASYGLIDEIIVPEDTRQKLVCTFEALENKNLSLIKKKHGNITL